ncbi:MAG: deoxyguanosinetriphosphate triphosphohydrolase [Deltaproteobacteria bacterium]|nr:deoxyguanosinetriphosphate triphosphohydrolase [Deltaproteobacteria bacterium]
MLSRNVLEKLEHSNLASYAAKSVTSKGRVYEEASCPFRPAFQRDRDRIIHSTAFRRLEYKTQVFVNHEGDYYRTRLTHSLEVAQISRGICRTLRLNEDLAEAIALAHDLGHTPFGHRGEEVLEKLMENYGGFEHNRQSYRVVTELERRYPDFQGLNLTYEVREGMAKHSGEFEALHVPEFPDKGYPTLEAQVVDVSDQIAYLNHDVDDGLESKMITLEQMRPIELWQHAWESMEKRHPQASLKVIKYQTIRTLIHRLVSDIQQETLTRIAQASIDTLDDVRARGEAIVRFSVGLQKKTDELLSFLYTNLYHHPHVEKMAKKAEEVISDLFQHYLSHPETLPESLYKAIQDNGRKERYICDYIAGMTDRFALDEHEKLTSNKF